MKILAPCGRQVWRIDRDAGTRHYSHTMNSLFITKCLVKKKIGCSLQSMHHLDTTKEKSEKDGWGTETRSCCNSATCLERRTKLIKPIIWIICYLIWNQATHELYNILVTVLHAICYHSAFHSLFTGPSCLFPQAQTLQLILARGLIIRLADKVSSCCFF